MSYVVGAANPVDDPIEPWRRLQERLDPLLSTPEPGDFAADLQVLALDILQMIEADPDLAILAMVRLDPFDYAVAHALQSAVACDVYGHSVGTPVEQRVVLIQAALTMNISMLTLQRELEWQSGPPTADQREQIRLHPMHALAMLEALGVNDPVWLQAVAEHHEAEDGSGYPSGCHSTHQGAAVLAVADRYCALLSRRGLRDGMSGNRAARSLYSGAHGKRQSLVRRVIEIFGQHPPGSLVRLVNGESGLVVRRGNAFAAEQVCVLLSPSGQALEAYELRNTSTPDFGIIAGLSERDVNSPVDYGRLRQAMASQAD